MFRKERVKKVVQTGFSQILVASSSVVFRALSVYSPKSGCPHEICCISLRYLHLLDRHTQP
jgi:hypothetical protein